MNRELEELLPTKPRGTGAPFERKAARATLVAGTRGEPIRVTVECGPDSGQLAELTLRLIADAMGWDAGAVTRADAIVARGSR